MRRIRPFKVVEEYSVLESMLNPAAPTQQQGAYIASIRKLRETHRRPQKILRANTRPLHQPVVDEKLALLLNSRDLTSKDIDTWLQINVIADIHPYEVLGKVDGVLEPMIRSASPTALWAIMQFLAKYWEIGVMGVRPLIRTARTQAEAVLERALIVSHKTEYALGSDGSTVELVGIPNLNRFDRFVASLFEYMKISRGAKTLDPVDDLLFRLHARCGPISKAQDQAKQFADAGISVSGPTSEELLSTLSRLFTAERDSANVSIPEFREKIRSDLSFVQDLLVAELTPGALRFLLVWLDNIDEFWSLVKVAETSPDIKDIYNECQLDMVRTIERFGLSNPKIMAQATGLIARIGDHTTVCSETMDEFLLACAKAGNAAGVSTALKARRKMGPVPEQVLNSLLDAFPLTNFGSTLAESRQIIDELRHEKLYKHKWNYSYFRAGGDVSKEWAKLTDKSIVTRDVDYLISFFVTVPESSPVSAEILDVALQSEFRTHIVNQLRAHDLVDEVSLNRAVATYAMNHPELSDCDVDAMLPDLENAHQVARIQNAELIWPI